MLCLRHAPWRGIMHLGVATMERTFTLEYWQDNGWYVGRLREVPGVFSQGESIAELEENIQDAYQLMLEEQAKPMTRPGLRVKDLVLQT